MRFGVKRSGSLGGQRDFLQWVRDEANKTRLTTRRAAVIKHVLLN